MISNILNKLKIKKKTNYGNIKSDLVTIKKKQTTKMKYKTTLKSKK